jgi:menaquinone-specific isochorismate synthase
MSEYALFKQPDGRAWLGLGPFEEVAEAPKSGIAFYWNDFDLTESRPWKVPSSVVELDAECRDLPWQGVEHPLVLWQHPETAYFEMAFRRIRRDVVAKRLEKMVPVLTASGQLVSGGWEALLQRVLLGPAGFWGYACVQEGRGFAGVTPELLFRSENLRVETMALAGTAKPGSDGPSFETDLKEIEEHELVVSYLKAELCKLGSVKAGEREVREAGALRHFQTLLTVDLEREADPTALVPGLHPTPAVGCLPRAEEWLTRLRDYRQLLQAPAFFGAPFGMIRDGMCQMVVSIRGLCWEGEKGFLPSGCGIVGGSAFDHEWRELRLKRDAVLKMMALVNS